MAFIWRAPLIAGSIIIGALGAIQAGWSGAELVVNAPLLHALQSVLIAFMFSAGAGFAILSLMVIRKITNRRKWVANLLFLAFVPGAWTGLVSDFDGTRLQVIRFGYANAFALERMSERGLFLTCGDHEIELTEDAREVCARVLRVNQGEVIPGSEHRCGALGLLGCVFVGPEKQERRMGDHNE